MNLKVTFAVTSQYKLSASSHMEIDQKQRLKSECAHALKLVYKTRIKKERNFT